MPDLTLRQATDFLASDREEVAAWLAEVETDELAWSVVMRLRELSILAANGSGNGLDWNGRPESPDWFRGMRDALAWVVNRG